jgi:hypothetical protein
MKDEECEKIVSGNYKGRISLEDVTADGMIIDTRDVLD